MRLSEPLVHLFDFSVDEILEHLPGATAPEWEQDPLRQKTFAVHRRTRSILFEWLDNNWQPGMPVTVQSFRYTSTDLLSAVSKAASLIAEKYSGSVVKLMLAELAVGGEIPVHYDSVPALMNVHRCHLPVRTNENVKFFIDYRPFYLKTGSVYEFDNTRWHSVSNESAEPRVHLICDVMPAASMKAA
jgi:hypothetical protein